MRLLSLALLFVALQTPTIHVDVNLRQIVATVTDAQGRYVTNLHSDDFVVEMNGVSQTIAHFTQDLDTPVTVGLVIDTSLSMASMLPAEFQAVAIFLQQMHAGDQFFRID